MYPGMDLEKVESNEIVNQGLRKFPVFAVRHVLEAPFERPHYQPGIELHFSHCGRAAYHYETGLFVQSGRDVVIVEGSWVHQVSPLPACTRFMRTVVCFGEEFEHWLQNRFDLCAFLGELKGSHPIRLCFTPDQWEQVDVNLRRIVAELAERGPAWQTAVFSHIVTLLVTIMRAHRDQPSEMSDFVEACIEFIDKHFDEEISLVHLAEYMHVSSKHLSREFSRVTGIHLSEFLWTRRVHQGKEMLIHRLDLEIEDIAHLCGFKTAAHFCRRFRETTGMTPTQCRQQTIGSG